MWLLFAGEPRPDAPNWRGRKVLAAVDAVAWPFACVLLLRQVPQFAGFGALFVVAVAVLIGLGRLYRAVWMNHRYLFTTWRWGKIAAALLLIGAVSKAMIGSIPGT